LLLLIGISACLLPGPVWTAERDATNELDLWQRGGQLLDAGENQQAREHFTVWLRLRSGNIAAAEGLLTAAGRQCDLESAVELIEQAMAAGEGSDPMLEALVRGARHRHADRHTAATPEFVQAAELAAAAGDSLSAAVALLTAVRSDLNAGSLQSASLNITRAESLIPADSRTADLRLLARGDVARVLHIGGQMAEADSLFRICLGQAEQLGARAQVCDCLNGLGATYARRRRIDVSLPFYRRALHEARVIGDRLREGLILTNVAYDETQARQLDMAAEHLLAARVIAEDCGYDRMLGAVHTGQGAVAEARGDRDTAILEFEASYQVYEKIGYEVGELGARQRMGYDLMVQGRYTEAIFQFGKCLEILERRESPMVLNWVYGGLALTHHRLGDLEQAEIYYRLARDANEALGDRTSVAWCHNSIGLLHTLRGNYRVALLRNREALEIYEELGDRAGIADAKLSIAEVHFLVGDWDAAMAYYRQAADIARSDGLEEVLQGASSGLASVCNAVGQPELAESHCRESLAIARKWSDLSSTVWALTDLADLCLHTGRTAEAQRYLAEALSMLEPEGQFILRSRTHQLLARSSDSPQEAVLHGRLALAAAVAGCLPEREWSCLSDLGVYLQALGEADESRASQNQAIQVVESLRRSVGTDELRRHMLRPALLPYERMIDLVLSGDGSDPAGKRAAAAEALLYTERSRAQILAARLRSAFVGAVEPEGGAFSAEARETQAAIAYVQARLQDPAISTAERRRLRDQVDELEEDFAMLQLRSSDGVASSPVELQPARLTVSELTGVLRTGEQALSYFLGSEISYLFRVEEQRVDVAILPPREVIEDKVRLFLRLRREAASGAREGRAPLPREILSGASEELYRLLVAPVAGDLVFGESLIIVPDGLLHRLPFAALAGPHGLMIEDYKLSTVPSLQTLGYLRARQAQRHRQGQSDRLDLLAVGYGGTAGDAPNAGQRYHPFSDQQVGNLPHAAAEAWEVAKLFPSSRVLTGAAATEAALFANPLARTDVLHIAAHSYADDRDIRRSFIVLASDESAGDDGLLQWHEVAAMDLGASLVTLASCRSAGGMLAVGEGVTGLTQAFLYAGGTSVLAAQTDVSDQYARRLMLLLYEKLRHGHTLATALREVQLNELAEGPNVAGYHPWADFVIIGDGQVSLADAGSRVSKPARVALLGAVGLILIFAGLRLFGLRRAEN